MEGWTKTKGGEAVKTKNQLGITEMNAKTIWECSRTNNMLKITYTIFSQYEETPILAH